MALPPAGHGGGCRPSRAVRLRQPRVARALGHHEEPCELCEELCLLRCLNGGGAERLAVGLLPLLALAFAESLRAARVRHALRWRRKRGNSPLAL
jgi:hypothetical protein